MNKPNSMEIYGTKNEANVLNRSKLNNGILKGLLSIVSTNLF